MSSWWLFCCSFGNFGSGRVRIAQRVGWRGWFCSFWPFLCHAGRDHCLQVWRAGLTTLPTFTDRFALRFGSFVWFLVLVTGVFFPSPLPVGHSNFRSQEWTHQFDLELNASILDLKSASATSPEINGMTGPQRQSEKRSPKDGKGEKSHRLPGLTINFLQDQPFHRGWQPCKTLDKIQC